MKQGLHPKWNHAAVVTCACGNTFVTGSQQDTLTVDICSKCHPFFTGEMRFVDRKGLVDKFTQRMKAAQAKQAEKAAKLQAKKAAAAGQPEEVVNTISEPLSYKQLLAKEQAKFKNVADNKAA
jgi:large subunit ribosomal protein L31